MKKNKFLFRMLIYIAFIIPVTSAPSWGQELEKLLELNLEELMNTEVITASKTPQRLSEVPATVRIITADQIKQRGYFTLEEALSDLPGFQFRTLLDSIVMCFCGEFQVRII